MNSVSSDLRAALSDTFMFYVKAHIFHWNVEGPTFSQLHELFGKIYDDAHSAVDDIAEHIRTLGEFAPQTLEAICSESSIEDGPEITDAMKMVEQLDADNAKVMDTLGKAQSAAEDANKTGIANFLQDRIDRHAKWSWMLSATAAAASGKTTVRRHVLYDYGREK